MKRALICLEQLGIGGVETFTITQIDEFRRRGIKCYVMCREGLLSDQIKNKKGVEFIEFDFKLQNTIDYSKVAIIEEIVKKKKIDFIYIHQFPCILYLLPVIFKYKIPYVAYLHNVVPKTCEWFMETYEIYKVLFPIFFEFASKIIAISDKVKEENMALFKLPEGKYAIINNSLDFSKYPDRKINEVRLPYKKLLLFGRLSEHKRNSIYTAVNFYKYCKEKYNENIELTVAGDGEIYDEIIEKYKNEDINFIGAISDVRSEIEKADILLGVDRCILESIASKKPAIICGYNGNTVLVTPNNLKSAIKENFTGVNLCDDKTEIFNYTDKEMKVIIEKNYKYVRKNLSIENSVYLDIEPLKNNFDIENIIKNINSYINKIDDLQKEAKTLFLTNQDLYKEIERLQNQGFLGLARKIKRRINSKKWRG